MAVAVIMPKQGQSVESCVITKWHKKVGDAVHAGEILFSYETDKAAFDEEAKVSGVLLAILANEGDDVPCLNNVCVIGEAGEDISTFLGGAPAQAAPAAEEKKEAAPQPAVVADKSAEGRVFISPRARAAAERQGVDAARAVPTGPNGRIIERDIYALSDKGTAAEAKPAVAEKAAPAEELKRIVAEDSAKAKSFAALELDYTDEKLSGVRKVIARTMQLSLSSMAQLTHNSSFDATRIQEYRKQVKAKGKDLMLEDITLNDMILFAVSRVLKKHPALNAHFLDDKIRYFSAVHLGIAVDTDRGLLVPTLYNADKKSLNEISKETKELIRLAQSGRIDPELLRNGTFTVSNLGALGIESFTPIINPPQTGILGVDNIMLRLKEVNGQVAHYPAMGLSLTYDHRAVDGAPASKFLKELGVALENFDLLLGM